MRGVTVTLYTETISSYDEMNAPVYALTPVEVADVLVGEPTSEELVSSTELYGKELVCILGIPKGDTNDWTNKKVSWTDAYGETHVLQTFGFPITGIEANIPTRWHKKVRCAKYVESQDSAQQESSQQSAPEG